MASGSSQARKLIPKRLEDELKNAPRFNPILREPKRTVADIIALSAETAMYDEILGPIVNRRSVSITSPRMIAQQPTTQMPNKDADFTVSLLTRLNDAEAEIRKLRRQLIEKNDKIETLERDNSYLKSVTDAPFELAEEFERMQKKNMELHDQLESMENFLEDYGLVWVGNKSSTIENDKVEVVIGSNRPTLSYAEFSMKIETLNGMIYQEPASVVTDESGRRARLVQASEKVENIRVVFYKNGLMVKRGPFRPSDSHSFTSFTRDIMDGYFPSEFRDEYPDGVLFVLVDKHDSEYTDLDGSGGRESFQEHLATNQFLRRLPKTVIRNGEVIDVRGDVAKILLRGDQHSTNEELLRAGSKGNKLSHDGPFNEQSSRDNPSKGERDSVHGVVASAAKTAATVGGGGKRSQIMLDTLASRLSGESDDRVTTIVQVRWLDGSVLHCKMFADDSIGDVRAELLNFQRHAAGQLEPRAEAKNEVENIGPPNQGFKDVDRSGGVFLHSTDQQHAFELQSVWPCKPLDDRSSLSELGLVPTGTIRAQKL